jgi:antibiotic biosynthesis monooxygenase (ABM) superfamily enzyme
MTRPYRRPERRVVAGRDGGDARQYAPHVSELSPSPAATEVVTFHVLPGREADFEAWAHDMTTVATGHPGHLGAAWLRPDAMGGAYQVVLRFSSPRLLDEWMSSPERAEMVNKLAGIATHSETRQTGTGLETWFSLPGQALPPPPKWKMCLVTFGAVYPLSIVFNWLVAPRVHDWALLVRAVFFPVALVPLLTFVVMPRLSRLLRGWLYDRGHPSPS